MTDLMIRQLSPSREEEDIVEDQGEVPSSQPFMYSLIKELLVPNPPKYPEISEDIDKPDDDDLLEP